MWYWGRSCVWGDSELTALLPIPCSTLSRCLVLSASRKYDTVVLVHVMATIIHLSFPGPKASVMVACAWSIEPSGLREGSTGVCVRLPAEIVYRMGSGMVGLGATQSKRRNGTM